MTCPACGDCAQYARRLVQKWYASDRAPRRSSEEVAVEKDRLARARAARKEFHAKRKAQKEAERLEAQKQKGGSNV